MKKQDLIVVAAFFALLLAWPYLASKLFPAAASKPKQVLAEAPAAPPAPATALLAPESTQAQTPPATPQPALALEPAASPAQPEQRFKLINADSVFTLSSKGGDIIAVELKNYRRTLDHNSGPVKLDFSGFPALAYVGLTNFSAQDDFELLGEPCAQALTFYKSNPAGLRCTRSFILDANYQLRIQDVFSNASDQAITIGDHEIQLGPMQLTGETRSMGLDHLGVDALPAQAGEAVVYWARKLPKLFKSEMKERALAGVPEYISQIKHMPVDWVAAKSKFFVQILAPAGGGAAYRIHAERKLLPGEHDDPQRIPNSATIASAAATILFNAKTLEPGESLAHSFAYYAGPKKYSILKQLGLHQEEVMDFGWWKPVCKFLLSVLNITYAYIPNYGIAIILLTILIRIIFWPLTHKSTESMKKMQGLQPLMAEIRAKYKDNPKKMQEETMGLYRKHKVNPMSGCLPMLIQIPVFVALFVVLRSAIELRFASFLWIRDLSEPERILAGILPIPLNILPILMAVTMAWQQRLTPTTDPNQQKMMLFFMPVMMLIMFYNMPSALVLYWTTNQCIMIAQMLIQKKKVALQPSGAKP